MSKVVNNIDSAAVSWRGTTPFWSYLVEYKVEHGYWMHGGPHDLGYDGLLYGGKFTAVRVL